MFTRAGCRKQLSAGWMEREIMDLLTSAQGTKPLSESGQTNDGYRTLAVIASTRSSSEERFHIVAVFVVVQDV